ncbi:YitT family protein [Neobacillus sp. PS2-9]|uniref:YitT family protein n=1 Tax=Neobacillus sp. PS2-9 TaxID=3070676 RepID=UPI0027DF76D0|nr:YitT family protein [Neobacillus sp. PS2-9]WML60267.1 YitT family protein [Neobacillus sp. PS2-9]
MINKLAIIGFGSTMLGIGINGFILPFHLINGGLFGVSLLIKYLFGFKAGIIFILLNIPVYMFAYKSDRMYFFNGLLGAILSGFMIELFFPLNGIFHLPILSSVIVGSIIIGIGVGVMLRNHISPGGMDLLALLISKWSKVNVGIIMVLMDGMIILTGLVLLQNARLLYSLIIITIVGLFATIITSYRRIHIL